MRRHRRVTLAVLLEEHRVSLRRALEEAAERGEPLSRLEVDRIVGAADLRLEPVETALCAYSRSALIAHRVAACLLPRPVVRGLARVRRFARRVGGLRTPRLGRLRHYDPRPLTLPLAYRNTPIPLNPITISIVTPSYQYGHFIERTIRSVLNQGYPRLEYVVQDGGSTDGTLDVLERYGDRIDWRSERDEGHADALNRGFASTTGEIMGWLNSDDLLLPGALAYVGAYFAANPDVDVVYGDRLMIDEEDREVGAWILPGHDDLVLTLADFVPQETLFWRRRIWDESGACLDCAFRYALDWDLLLRFREAGAKIVHLPRFLGAFRIHREQRTSVELTLGQQEMAQLRERVHGRPVPLEEVNRLIQPFLRRHVRTHLRHRLTQRLARDEASGPSGASMTPVATQIGANGVVRQPHHSGELGKS